MPSPIRVRRGVLLVLLLLLVPVAPRAARAELEILVPAYFYPVPGSPWEQLTADAGTVPITAILNPASGPGVAADPVYVATVTAFRAAGGRILGYVPTTYATRSAAAVLADVDSYDAFYAIDGIFLDEVTSDDTPAHLDYYEALYAGIRARGAGWRVIGNPGTNAAHTLLTRPCFDALVLFENGTGYDTYVTDSWVYGEPRARIAHLLYDVPDTPALLTRVDQALSRGVGLLFITDDTLVPNPWDTLPAYWGAEVARLAALNQSAAPERPAGPPPLRVRPNPARSTILLETPVALPVGTRLVLTGVDGRRVREIRIEAPWPAGRGVTLRLDAGGESLANGVYLLSVAGMPGVGSARVVVRR